MSRMYHGHAVRSRLFAAFLLSSALTPAGFLVGPVMAAPDPATDPGWQAFANSSYGYCDAFVLSQFWKIGVFDAKVAIGNKILSRNEQTLDETLGMAFSRFRCRQSFNLNDASKLAEAWTATGIA